MNDLIIRRAEKRDIPYIGKLLLQVHKVHSDARPDIFIPGARKYTDAELEEIFCNDETPVFVAQLNEGIKGYAFCVFQKHKNSNNMTNIKTLYIDDLCVDENARGKHIGTALYHFVLDFAKAEGCYNVTLNVWADNKNAAAFYEKIGLKIQKIGMEKIL